MAIVASDWAALNPSNANLPPTIAGTASPAPTTFLTVFSSNVAVTSITPPVTHAHMLAFYFPGTAGITAGNNIQTTKASVAGEIMLLYYNPVTAKYSPVG